MTKEKVLESLCGLLEAYYDRDSAGKSEVIALFRESADAAAYRALESGIRNNEHDRMRNAAMEIAVALGSRSLTFLTGLLADADEEVRTFAGVMLGTLKDAGATPALVKALADPDMNVKHAAAEALGKIGDGRAVGPLIDALSADLWLQFPAVMALGDVGDARAVGPLVALLKMPGMNMPAIQALGKIGDPAALDPLAGLLDDEDPALREWVLEAAAAILSRWPESGCSLDLNARTRAMLVETLRADSLEARRNAAIMLGCCKVQESVPALVALDADHDMKEVARKALWRIGQEPA